MKISIITVCLNSEKTIEQTIQSVISQNDDNYEYIIIDGESTDRTLDIVNKYKNNIAIIRSEVDSGVYDAMNKGISIATGDIIGIINSDDWYEPNLFWEKRKSFLESNADVVHGKLNSVHKDGKMETHATNNIEEIRYMMNIYHPTLFVRKEVYEKYGAFRLKYEIAADYDFVLRLYINGVKFFYLDRMFTNYRSGGLSDEYSLKCAEEVKEISQNYLAYAPLDKRNYFRFMINRQFVSAYFDEMLVNCPAYMGKILNQRLGVGQTDNIAIFGVGKWGLKAYDILQGNGVKALLLVDNDRKKQNTSVRKSKVLSPESLENFKGVILVLVRNYSREILEQLKCLNNPDLYCISWGEIAAEYIQLREKQYAG